MIKMITTDASMALNVGIKELGRVAEDGEVFEVEDESRAAILSGSNPYKSVFAIPIKEEVVVNADPVVEEPKPKKVSKKKKKEEVVDERTVCEEQE